MTSRAGYFVACVILAGAALRIALAVRMYPMTGDPVYSYCYRALLLADGQWRAVFLLWHLPGYPLLLGLATRLTGGYISPYAAGTAVSIACYVGLAVVIDRLVAPRVRWPATRIAVASFVAFYETLFLWAAAPLTEPPYLLLIYGAVLAVDRTPVGAWRTFLAGSLLGIACTMRMEGVAAFAGVVAYLGIRAAVEPGPGRFCRIVWAVGPAVLGWGLFCGWLFLFPDYLLTCRRAQEASFTIPPVRGLGANVVRLAACAYHACTVWLPFTLLLPYWLVLGVAFLHPGRAVGRGSLHSLLLAVVVPSLLVVSASIMHKRTGSFLLPGAAAWFGLGVEIVIERAGLDRLRFGVAAAVLVALVLNLVQATRIVFSLARDLGEPTPPSWVAGRLLSRHADEVGPVWAWKAEPEVYAFWNKPVYYDPWWRPDKEYLGAYDRNRGDPAGFVAELRRRGCRYLTFVKSLNAPGETTEAQPYCTEADGLPLRSDLDALIVDPAANGLGLLGQENVDGGTVSVYLFKVH
jgi:hypothetical protein